MPRPPARMYRREFEQLAGISKTRYFSLLGDPLLRHRLDAGKDENGCFVNRRKAERFIKELLQKREAARLRVRENLGAYASKDAPPRGRPCPTCGRRITRKRTTCRHCGEFVDAV